MTALLLSVAFAGTIWRYEHAQAEARQALFDSTDRMRDQETTTLFWHEREAIDEYLITGAPQTLKEIGLMQSEFNRVASQVIETHRDYPQLAEAMRANDRLMKEFRLHARTHAIGAHAIEALHPYEEAVLAPLRSMDAVEKANQNTRSAAAASASRQARMVAIVGAAIALIAGLGFAIYVTRLLRHVTRQTLVLAETLDEREQTYATLQDREQQLRQAQKTEAVGLLAGGIAHDFNNMLLAITGHGALALEELEPEQSRVRHALEQIALAAGRAAALTSQLLAFSRQQVVKRQVVDVNGLVTGLTEMLRPLLGATIELVVDLDPRTGCVEADPGQLEQVITNLVVNGRDAMRGSGGITITSRPAEDRAVPRALPPGSYVVLTVTDSGDGMDEETQTRAFDPFFTTKEQGKGTGLGLATVHGIVTQGGGDVQIESVLGIGTTISVYLPSTDASPPGTDDEAPSVGDHGSETVLLVEDDLVIQALLVDVLGRDGYEVIAASTGEEALALMESSHRFPELLITDMTMPGMSGGELASLLHPLHPGLRVIYMSGYNHDAALSEAAEIGLVTFLQKPFTPTEILTTIRTVLALPAGSGRPLVQT